MLPRFSRISVLLLVSLLFGFIFANDQNYAELPFCEDTEQPAVFVSTLDGKLSALDAKGEFLWDIDTGPGPLLISNIHKLELTNNGQWIKLIPSLSGSLYKFDGKTVDAIPITADNLLKSSFLYSDDLVIAGGREVRTYGLAVSSGEHLYECTINGCQNKTENQISSTDNIIVVERSTITVRAHEPRSGSERWNFSVGLHNIKVPHINCVNFNPDILNFNLTAVLPEGLLTAKTEKYEMLWSFKFKAPIVNVWKFDGRDMTTVDLFDYTRPKDENMLSPAIYLGMHNKQPYIHESEKMQSALRLHHYTSSNKPSTEVVESDTIARIPWKPVSANSIAVIPADNDDVASKSILYSSEYANGNGYYLYSEKDLNIKNRLSCDNNSSKYEIPEASNGSLREWKILVWWKEIMIITATMILMVNLYCTGQFLPRRRREVSLPLHNPEPIREATPLPIPEKERTTSESSSHVAHNSRFLNDFDTIQCLGKGGFGVVFEVVQKIDECGYAIKRIALPNDQNAQERMRREVKSLAKLDHKHIVRYYNCWFEDLPAGLMKEHDYKHIKDFDTTTSQSQSEAFSKSVKSHRRNNSTIIDMGSGSISFDLDVKFDIPDNKTDSNNSDFIIFGEDSTDTQKVLEESSKGYSTQSSLDDTTHNDSHDKSDVHLTREKREDSRMYLYIQMQLCKKESLKDWLFTNKERDCKQMFNFFHQIVEAVDYIHSQNMIHRDLKPSNIYFSSDGVIKVGDFGLATEMRESQFPDSYYSNLSMKSYTKEVGTDLYMSPEQKKGLSYNLKVDIFSLGIILVELLLSFDTEMERYKILSNVRKLEYPEQFEEAYEEVIGLLDLMLAEDPSKRPETDKIKTWPSLPAQLNP